jgi:hypothetical protein
VQVGEKWLFSATSRGFGYAYEAVRIRANNASSPAFSLFTPIPAGLLCSYTRSQQGTQVLMVKLRGSHDIILSSLHAKP